LEQFSPAPVVTLDGFPTAGFARWADEMAHRRPVRLVLGLPLVTQSCDLTCDLVPLSLKLGQVGLDPFEVTLRTRLGEGFHALCSLVQGY
jgi:hypothetical protein